MDFSLTPAQQEMHDAAIEFARRELVEGMIERDREGAFSRDAWVRCAGFGVLGLPVPHEYGGSGSDLTTTLAVMEGLGYGARDQGLLFSLNAHLWTNTIPLLQYGTEEQKQRWLPGLCDGRLIGANAATEAEAGSDVYALRTHAVRDGDEWVLDGAKVFVTNAPVCDLIAAYATIDPALGVAGVTAFLVEADRPGVVVGAPADKMGLRTSPMAEVAFEACRVPASALLGRVGRGAEVFACSMEWERGSILASCVGVMRRQLEDAIAHARRRKQFGQRIGRFQSVANRLVDMKVRLDVARLLVYRIGWLKDRGADATMEAAIAKLHVAECHVASCLDAIQVHGAYGYMTEQGVERDLRDAIGGRLYSGTSEIQRNIIARQLGL